MAGTLRFDWNGSGGSARLRAAAERALVSLQPEAQTIWDSIVPVKTGALRASWYSTVTPRGMLLMLVFGATVHYTIFVELGTIHMEPRYPLRRTAQAVAPMVLPRLFREMAA
jgi:hypothetical protein